MLRHWDSKLLPAVARFQPDFIIVSAGLDSRQDDLLGCFNLTDDVFRRMTRMAMDLADDYAGGKLVSLLEGGYNIEKSPASHPRWGTNCSLGFPIHGDTTQARRSAVR